MLCKKLIESWFCRNDHSSTLSQTHPIQSFIKWFLWENNLLPNVPFMFLQLQNYKNIKLPSCPNHSLMPQIAKICTLRVVWNFILIHVFLSGYVTKIEDFSNSKGSFREKMGENIHIQSDALVAVEAVHHPNTVTWEIKTGISEISRFLSKFQQWQSAWIIRKKKEQKLKCLYNLNQLMGLHSMLDILCVFFFR